MLGLIGVAAMQRSSSARIGCVLVLLIGAVFSKCTAATTALSPGPHPSSSGGSAAVTDETSDPLPLRDNAKATSDCDAEAAQFALGETATPALIDSVKARSGAPFVRVIRAGEGATRDFIAARINIQLDAAGRISDIRCG